MPHPTTAPSPAGCEPGHMVTARGWCLDCEEQIRPLVPEGREAPDRYDVKVYCRKCGRLFERTPCEIDYGHKVCRPCLSRYKRELRQRAKVRGRNRCRTCGVPLRGDFRLRYCRDHNQLGRSNAARHRAWEKQRAEMERTRPLREARAAYQKVRAWLRDRSV